MKEIEDALLAGESTSPCTAARTCRRCCPTGLAIAAVLPREDPRDAWSCRGDQRPLTFDALSRARHRATHRHQQRPAHGAAARDVPGRDVSRRSAATSDTRLRKLDEGEFDAIVLAAAGLKRLGLGARISRALPIDACVPAPGQGIIAVEIAPTIEATAEAVARASTTSAARPRSTRSVRVVTRLGGGCQMPIGVHAAIDATAISLRGCRRVAGRGARDPRRVARDGVRTTRGRHAAAADLRSQGADDILAEAQRAHADVEGIQP